MADGFRVQPSDLEEAAPQFTNAASDLRQAFQSLGSSLARLGACWGNDKPGSQFGAGYEAKARDLEQALANIARGLDSIGEGVGTMAANYRGAEGANVSRFTPNG